MFAALLVAKSKFKLIVNVAQGYGGGLIVMLSMFWKELTPLEASIDLQGVQEFLAKFCTFLSRAILNEALAIADVQ